MHQSLSEFYAKVYRKQGVSKSVHFPFIIVHRTFILEQKTSKKTGRQATPKIMSYDYAPSCRTTIPTHVVRS